MLSRLVLIVSLLMLSACFGRTAKQINPTRCPPGLKVTIALPMQMVNTLKAGLFWMAKSRLSLPKDIITSGKREMVKKYYVQTPIARTYIEEIEQ